MKRPLCTSLGVAALLAGANYCLAATTTISIPDVTGPPGSSQELCVNMTSNGNQVAGVQMDLVWDANCLSMVMADADSAACQKNPAISKETFRTKVNPGGNSMRVLFLSISDLSPMPDGQLFCCPFDIAASAGGKQCALMANRVILSDPAGQRPAVQAQPGRVIVTNTGAGGGGQGGPRPAVPIAPPVVSVPGAAPPASGGGVAAPPGGGAAAPAGKAPQAVGGAPVAPAGQQQPQAAGEAPAAEAIPQGSPIVTAAPAAGFTSTPQRTAAAVKTPTPHVQGTKTTSPAVSTPAAATTPKAKGKVKKKRTATPAAQ